jgi:diguanylate cyclase (GGDEF)-like protein
MASQQLFFWVLPVTVALIAAIFAVTARSEKRHKSASVATIGFAVAFIAILLDTQRDYLPWWAFSLAVPLHWMVLVCIIDAFLARHGDRMPRTILLPLIIAGCAINFGFTFWENSSAVRVPNASIICVILLAIATHRLLRYRMGRLDRAIATIIGLNCACYALRTLLWFYLGQQAQYAQNSQFSDYMTMFYFTSGISMFATALLLMLAIIIDILARNQLESTIDPLTQTLNRRGLDKLQENGEQWGAVIVLDLDNFKAINDSYGHAGGDKVLVAVSAILRDQCQHFGHVARLGGEEFAIIVKHSHGEATAMLAEMLRLLIAGLHLEEIARGCRVSASFGIATCHAVEPLHETMRKADMALYEAKRQGRNRVVRAGQENLAVPQRLSA